MKYETENEILAVIEQFENATIRRENWGHAEHLIVANHYLAESDFAAACEKMRAGIFNLLRAFAVDLTKEMPYHETLTIFWLKTIEQFRNAHSHRSNVEICRDLIENFDKNYPLRFYSRELLFSDEARKEFVRGDL